MNRFAPVVAGLAAFALMLALGQSASAVNIYVENFGGAGPLDGATPNVSATGASWAAGTHWGANGAKSANGHSNALLPFHPKAGNVYTVSLDVNPDVSGSNDWFAVGFTTDIDANGPWHPSVGNNAVAWVLNRENDASPTVVQTFQGPVTAGAASHDFNPDKVGPVNMQVVLDTQGANWTAEWFVDGASIRGPVAYGTNPSINYVGIGGWSTATGSVDNFRLESLVADLPPVLVSEGIGTKLLQDNFNVIPPGNPDTFDVNFNLAQRQAGSALGTVTYRKIDAPNESQVGNNLTSDKVVIQNGNALLLAFAGGVELEQNFNGALSDGGLAVSFDAAPVVNNTQSGNQTHWVSIGFGFDQDAAPPFSINNPIPHFGVLFRENGDWQAFEGNAAIGAGTFDANTLPDTLLQGFEIIMTDPTDGNPFDGVGQSDFDVYYQGNLLFSHSVGGGGYANNYINLQANQIGYIDNLMIRNLTPTIPEPASAALLAIGGLALLRRKRRA